MSWERRGNGSRARKAGRSGSSPSEMELEEGGAAEIGSLRGAFTCCDLLTGIFISTTRESGGTGSFFPLRLPPPPTFFHRRNPATHNRGTRWRLRGDGTLALSFVCCSSAGRRASSCFDWISFWIEKKKKKRHDVIQTIIFFRYLRSGMCVFSRIYLFLFFRSCYTQQKYLQFQGTSVPG